MPHPEPVTDCDAVVWPIQGRLRVRFVRTRRYAIWGVILGNRRSVSDGGGARHLGYSVSIKAGAGIESTSVGSSQATGLRQLKQRGRARDQARF